MPQREEDIARMNAQEAAPAAPVQAPLAPPALSSSSPVSGISFHNSRAVLVSLFVAAGALIGLLAIGVIIPPLAPAVLCGAGFVAARVYRRQSNEPLSTAAGARLGWMTGLWLFLPFAVVCALAALLAANQDVWQQIKDTWARLPQASKLLTLTQHDFEVQLLVSLPITFLFLTVLPGLGGMLGARMAPGRRPS